jgi:hypothetical protein
MTIPLARLTGTHRENALRLAKEYRAAMDKIHAICFVNTNGLSVDERAELDLQSELAYRAATRVRLEYEEALRALEAEQAAA